MSNDIVVIEGDIMNCRDQFAAVLSEPSINFEREARFAVQVIEANTYLTKIVMQNRQALADAVINIASIGISLNPAKKQAYLVPRKGKVCLDISYMGLMDLAMATGSVRWGQAKLVYEQDEFELNGVDRPPTHKTKPFEAERGLVVGVYVVIKTADGDYLTHTMNAAAVVAIRDRSEAWKAYVKDNSKLCPWVTDPGEMWKKTCVKQAYKYWPKTERLEKAVHFLNTETDEGIQLTNSKPVSSHDPELLQLWKDRAELATTQENLIDVWRKAVIEFQEKNDKVAYEGLKTFITSLAEKIKAQQEQ